MNYVLPTICCFQQIAEVHPLWVSQHETLAASQNIASCLPRQHVRGVLGAFERTFRGSDNIRASNTLMKTSYRFECVKNAE